MVEEGDSQDPGARGMVFCEQFELTVEIARELAYQLLHRKSRVTSLKVV
jgi:hypothetical protein